MIIGWGFSRSGAPGPTADATPFAVSTTTTTTATTTSTTTTSTSAVPPDAEPADPIRSATRRVSRAVRLDPPPLKRRATPDPDGNTDTANDDSENTGRDEQTPSIFDQLDPVDRGAAIPPAYEPLPQPAGLQISTVDVSGYPIRSIGLLDSGELEVPDETEIGWYRYGSTANQPGATVLAAHVSWNQTEGPFFELSTIEPGDQIEMSLDDGTLQRYEVTERTRFGKDELPRERIWRTTGPESLVLITCGGDFHPQIRRYQDNVVVFASPLD